MDEAANMVIDPATAAAMTITAASTVAEHWLAANPMAAAHLHTGYQVAIEVIVTANPVELQISFIDPSDGVRYPKARVQLP